MYEEDNRSGDPSTTCCLCRTCLMLMEGADQQRSRFPAPTLRHQLLCMALCLAAYWNSTRCGFAFDDFPAVVNNRDLRPALSSWLDMWSNDYWGTPLANDDSHRSYRPLTTLTFRLQSLFLPSAERQLPDPWSLHVVNVMIHVFVTELYLWTLCRLSFDREVSLVAGVLFAVHPIHTEAVTGVVGRAELLSAVFYLLTIMSFLANYDHPWLRRCYPLFALGATFSKEQGITVLPVCMTLMVLYPSKDLHMHSKNVQSSKNERLLTLIILVLKQPLAWVKIIVLTLISAMVFCLRLLALRGGFPQFSRFDNPASVQDFPWRHLTYFYVYALNFRLLLCPDQLLADWTMGTVPLVTSAGDPRNLLTLSFLLFFLFLLYFALLSPIERCSSLSYSRCVAVALALYLWPTVPTSNLLFPVGFVVAERTLYLPSMGFCLLVALGYCRLRISLSASPSSSASTSREEVLPARVLYCPRNFYRIVSLVYRRLKKHLSVTGSFLRSASCSLGSVTPLRFLPGYLLVAIVTLYSVKCILRNRDWFDERQLFLSALKVTTKNSKVYNNLGHIYEADGRYVDALKYFMAAADVQPDDVGSWMNVGRLYAKMERLQRAEEAYLKALKLFRSSWAPMSRSVAAERTRHLYVAPAHFHLFLGLASVYERLSQPAKAERLLREAISYRPQFDPASVNLAVLLVSQNRTSEALVVLRNGLKYSAQSTQLLFNAGVACARLAMASEALKYFNLVLNRNPRHYMALTNAASVLTEMIAQQKNQWKRERDRETALQLLSRAAEASPGTVSSWTDLGRQYYALRDLGNAKRSFERAIVAESLTPHHASSSAFKVHEISPESAKGLHLHGTGEQVEKRSSRPSEISADSLCPHGSETLKESFHGDRGQLDAVYLHSDPKNRQRSSYEACMPVDPVHSVVATYNLAVVEQELGNARSAADLLKRLLRVDPGHLEARRRLCDVLMSVSDFLGAEACLRQALKRDQGDIGALHNLCIAMISTRKVGQAAECLQQVRKLMEHLPQDSPYGRVHFRVLQQKFNELKAGR